MSKLSFGDYAAARDENLDEGLGDMWNAAKDFLSPAGAAVKDAATTISNKARQFGTDYMGDVNKGKTVRALKTVATEISNDLLGKIDTVAKPTAELKTAMQNYQQDMLSGFQNARARLNDERFANLIDDRSKSALNTIIKLLAQDVSGVNEQLQAANDVVSALAQKAQKVRAKVYKVMQDVANGVELQKVLGKVQAKDPVDTPMVKPKQSRLDARRLG
jgi:hypothetical protein